MTAFTFSAEQLRSAPPEVRRWMAGEIAAALGGLGELRREMPQPQARPVQPMTLAPLGVPEAARMFELIGEDPFAARLFLELARESTVDYGRAGLHVLRMADLLRNAGLAGEDQLLDGLAALDRAFRQVHGEQAGTLFGFDDAGHLYIHETTQTSIRRLWEELSRARAAAERQPLVEPVPGPQSFIPPHLGPSEDIAGHAGRAPHW